MPIQTIDTITIKQSLDLRELASQYTTLHKESSREVSGPCPKCGGDDRFHCTVDWFICRQCHPQRGDAIEFVQWLNSVDFKTAVASLTNAPMPAPTDKPISTPTRAIVRQSLTWYSKAAALVDAAHRRLFDDHDQAAEAGRVYLEQARRLEPHTWQMYRLGYTEAAIPGTNGKASAPAIVMPWFAAGQVIGIRYRFLEAQNGHKQTALYGSSFAGRLFGGQVLPRCAEDLRTLVICEGELNCCSVWQVAHDIHLDVLSLGSESATLTPAAIEYAKRHATVLCWLDKEERARVMIKTLELSPESAVKSPNGQDANDLLKAGQLGAFLSLRRFMVTRSHYEQERLLWDLWDAARLPSGVDAGTAAIIEQIAKILGRAAPVCEVEPGRWMADLRWLAIKANDSIGRSESEQPYRW